MSEGVVVDADANRQRSELLVAISAVPLPTQERHHPWLKMVLWLRAIRSLLDSIRI